MQERVSPDGAHYWDGAAWRPLSPDRRSFWGGSAWRPVETGQRRGRRWPWLAAAAAALAVLLGICTVALDSGASRAGRARPAASAAGEPTCARPCADAGGWVVQAANVRYDVRSGSQFRRPEAGNVFVGVDVTFLNRTVSERHANPFEFVLRDGAGVKHPVTSIDACPLWSAVNLTAGAAYGPKCLAFEATAGQPAGLALVWTPGPFGGDHEIVLT